MKEGKNRGEQNLWTCVTLLFSQRRRKFLGRIVHFCLARNKEKKKMIKRKKEEKCVECQSKLGCRTLRFIMTNMF